MWISNAATAAMMVPIATAVISQLQASELQLQTQSTTPHVSSSVRSNGQMPLTDINSNNRNSNASSKELMVEMNKSASADVENTDSRFTGKWEQMGKGLLMAVAYSASIGGIATVTGAAPNLIFIENLERYKNELFLHMSMWSRWSCVPLTW